MEECSSLMQNLIQIRCSTCSVILNAVATQYTCSLKGVYCPHGLIQRSHHCSHMCIPVHSLWLPGYIDVLQTILVILTMAGLSSDRPHILWILALCGICCLQIFSSKFLVSSPVCLSVSFPSLQHRL